ncbi:very short patch repair endonuclease [Hydrogenovibrio sp. JE_KL2]|uniref:very short patch repair endonuclease n=1 Tax=Hydrogenovibrio sp. JE_KL2 TaxID=2651188 RepID=UPI00128AFC6E|nr:DNA mismatch endonuclease Vsr [Hydrogenovibrio sp. JE_KL2]MPQ76836.1 DNA mismatch endonuclease Vsr [Hydrogenovibrio sp. JE_KL2]
MVDKVDSQTRSKMMSRVRNKNTNIEVKVRKALFAKGFRYKINDKNLPGSPDIVLPKYKAVIFVNGCFWHGHHCKRGKLPQANNEFWLSKINQNINRDKNNNYKLMDLNWRVAILWECSIRGKGSIGLEEAIRKLSTWLKSSSKTIEIPQ